MSVQSRTISDHRRMDTRPGGYRPIGAEDNRRWEARLSARTHRIADTQSNHRPGGAAEAPMRLSCPLLRTETMTEGDECPLPRSLDNIGAVVPPHRCCRPTAPMLSSHRTDVVVPPHRC